MEFTDLHMLLQAARVRRSLPSPTVRRALREGADLSQGDLGAVLGVTESAVSRWESGRRAPRREHLDAYVAVLAALAREAV